MTTIPRDERLVRLELTDRRWSALADSADRALPFHDPTWAAFLAECYRFPAFAFALLDDQGQAVAGLPLLEVRRPLAARRWVCLPFTDVCGPLGDREAVATLIAAVDDERKANGVKELVVRDALPARALVPAHVAVRHVLELPADPDEALGRFRPGVRQGIRAAERAGVTVERATSREALTETFYDLHVATRRRLGVPVQGRRFFELLWDRVLAPGGGSVLIASVGGRPVAAAVFLAARDVVVYKFGASDAEAWGARPNHALFWAAIRQACEEGRRQLDFGRSDFQSEGLRRFKASWGAEEIPLVYSATHAIPPHSGESSGLGRVAAWTIRRSPPIVCRAVGHVLYRYAA